MSNEKKEVTNAFVSYVDDDGTVKHGTFEKVVIPENFTEIKNSKNTSWYPPHRVNKIKKENEK